MDAAALRDHLEGMVADVSVSGEGHAHTVTVSVFLVVLSATASAAVGLLGGLPAGIRASRTPIVAALRSVD